MLTSPSSFAFAMPVASAVVTSIVMSAGRRSHQIATSTTAPRSSDFSTSDAGQFWTPAAQLTPASMSF